MKRHHDHSNTYKYLSEVVAYSFKGSVCYPLDREHGSMQKDTVLDQRQQEVD